MTPRYTTKTTIELVRPRDDDIQALRDRLASERKWSRFVIEAIREKMEREDQ